MDKRRFRCFATAVFAAVSAFALLTACSSGGDDGASGPNVYVAGMIASSSGVENAALWVNGAARRLSGSISWGKSVCVSGGDVYVAGEVVDLDAVPSGWRATLWVNGTARRLSEDESGTSSVCVVGKDVYVAGMVAERATLWTNGIPEPLSDRESDATSVFVHDGDAYVAGTVFYNPGHRAMLWKNGVAQSLDIPQSANSAAYSVIVLDGVVCVAGNVYENYLMHPTLWTDGAALWLDGSSTSQSANARSVCASGGDVYVGGNAAVAGRGGAVVWKVQGGVPQIVQYPPAFDDSGILGSETYSVSVSGDDVYAVGYAITNNAHAMLWKNGTSKRLSDGYSWAYSVFVEQR